MPTADRARDLSRHHARDVSRCHARDVSRHHARELEPGAAASTRQRGRLPLEAVSEGPDGRLAFPARP
ncbi:MAG: hypothetical protein ACR2J6_02240 [Thermoleophilaceae bacterium]